MNFEERTTELKETLEEISESYIAVIEGKDVTNIQMKGTLPDLMFLTRIMVNDLREKMNAVFPEEVTERVLKTLLYSDEEMAAEQALLNEHKIPAWLKKLMDLESEEGEEKK